MGHDGEVIFLGGRPVVGFLDQPFGVTEFGIGDFNVWPSDLLAYRKEWEPFVAAHLALWRWLNSYMEGSVGAQQCPPSIFDASAIANLDPTTRAYCAALDLTRIRTSDTNPGGILTQWNAWKDKTSADVLAATATMLKWHQDVVARVSGPYKNELLQIADILSLKVELPALPDFSIQQKIISQIEGTYIAAKGVLQIVGYASATTVQWVGDQVKAVTEGLSSLPKAIAKAVSSPGTWIGVAAVAAVVGAGLLIYYVPKRKEPS